MTRNHSKQHLNKKGYYFIFLAIPLFSLMMMAGHNLGVIEIRSRLPYLVLFSVGLIVFMIYEDKHKNIIIRYSFLFFFILCITWLSSIEFYKVRSLRSFSIIELFYDEPAPNQITLPLFSYLKEHHTGQSYVISNSLKEMMPEKDFLMWTEANQVTYKDFSDPIKDQWEIEGMSFLELGPIHKQHFYIDIEHNITKDETIYIVDHNSDVYVFSSVFIETGK